MKANLMKIPELLFGILTVSIAANMYGVDDGQEQFLFMLLMRQQGLLSHFTKSTSVGQQPTKKGLEPRAAVVSDDEKGVAQNGNATETKNKTMVTE